MSHLATIKTEVRDPVAIRAASARLKLKEPTIANDTASVPLTTWGRADVNLKTGEVRYDTDYRRQFNAFMQAYAIEKTKIEAKRKGHLVTESPMAGGKVKVTITLAGGA